MKRLTTITMVLALAAFTLLSLSAFAYTGPSFIDEDGDGICDNYQNGGRGLGQGNRANFVDADGDGVCDNYQSGQRKGAGSGKGNARHSGGNFVDADGDGVCDNYLAGQKKGAHKGRGRGNSRNAASKK